MLNVELHAVNLHNPSHMERTPDGRLLISQSTAGSILDITKGGDMLNSKPFAKGLSGPASILPRKTGEILVAEMWGGSVRDISTGGDISKNPAWMEELSGPYSLAEVKIKDRNKLYVTESYNGRDSWLSEITGAQKRQKPVIDNIPVTPGYVGLTPIEAWPTDWQKYALGGCVKNWETSSTDGKKHYLAISDLGQVMDITGVKGDYMQLVKDKRAIAWGLKQVGALKPHPTNGLLYITQPSSGEVMALDPSKPQNYHFQPPVLQGLKYPSCVRFSEDGETMYVCDQADGVVWKVRDFHR